MDTLKKVAQLSMPDSVPASSYSVVMLSIFSLLGILIHWLVDLKKATSQSLDIDIKHYLKTTWISSVVSLLLCVAAILLRNEIYAKIPVAIGFEGLCFLALGFVGDSALPLIFGFAKSKGIDLKQ